MLLVIPSITIKDGFCLGRIANPTSPSEDDPYKKPEDRARLLRKENAKALHLIFKDESVWNPKTLELTNRIRQAVDIPIEVSLSTIPENILDVQEIIQSGIYRLFLPHEADDYFLSDCIHDFSRQKIVVSIPIESVSRELFDRLKNDGLRRICITLPDEIRILPLEKLREIARIAKENDMRLSLLFGVYSYKELMKLDELEPGFDSVILGLALEDNAFPCQGIWRQNEERSFLSGGIEANLWKNPLENVPHV